MQAAEVLITEHRVIEQVLTCLEKLADRCATGEPLDRASAWQAIDFFRYFADSCHHGKEEGHLFPVLEAHGVSCASGSTAAMRQEHRRGRAYIDAMTLALVRAADQDFVVNAREYVRLLREHIRKEDQCLFPAAAQAFSPAEDEAVLQGYTHVEREEMGEGTHADYLELANALADRLDVPRATVAPASGQVCCHHSHR
jgi:hemerythrin-like domain-containing protein